jgi:hypothetical protein
MRDASTPPDRHGFTCACCDRERITPKHGGGSNRSLRNTTQEETEKIN